MLLLPLDLRDHPRGERLDRVDDRLEAGRVEQIEGVLGTRQLRVHDRIGGGAADLVDKVAGPCATKNGGAPCRR